MPGYIRVPGRLGSSQLLNTKTALVSSRSRLGAGHRSPTLEELTSVTDQFTATGRGSSKEEAVADARRQAEDFFGNDSFHEVERGQFDSEQVSLQGLRRYTVLILFESGPEHPADL